MGKGIGYCFVLLLHNLYVIDHMIFFFFSQKGIDYCFVLLFHNVYVIDHMIFFFFTHNFQSSCFCSNMGDESPSLLQEKKSLYASTSEFQSLIKQVLSWDIRSLSQRNRPHDTLLKKENDELLGNTSDVDEHQEETTLVREREQNALNSNEIIYHLILEGLDVSYRIDHDGYVIVEKISTSDVQDNKPNFCNYLTWKDKLQ